MMTEGSSAVVVRLDRWLWAARFFKTRSMAATAIDGGKVQVNGARVKRASHVHESDLVRIRKPPYETTVEVVALSEHRGPAKEALELYRETAESVAAREMLRTQLKSQPSIAYDGKGRPTKRDRRAIDQFKRGG